MSLYLLGVVACIYLWVALGYAKFGQHGMALAFVAYAVANLGFMLDAWARR
jgi:hypothetical protein